MFSLGFAMNETRRFTITPSLKTLHRSLFPAIAVARFESLPLYEKTEATSWVTSVLSAIQGL